MANTIQAPKGTKDVLPSEVYKWRYVENILRQVAADFNFTEIRFPAFEHTELFLRGVGDTTDVVQKEMYTFLDKGSRSITLRPEGTASVVRSFIENSLYAQGLPVKVFYIAPNFRYEKPQSGRLRQHHQFGVEYFGSYSPAADAEVIALADTFLKRLGILNITVKINSIGCAECRREYHKALKSYFAGEKGRLCPTCLERLEKNPMRILDCKSPICSEIAKDAPKTIDYLCGECAEHFESVKKHLSELQIQYAVDPMIVRGLDYYSKTVFEFESDDLGAQKTVCAGGRYDTLVETLGGPKTAGLGFGSGIERLMMVMDALNIEIPKPDGVDIFIATLGQRACDFGFKLAMDLRRAGISAEFDTMGRSLKAQMKYADKIGANFSIVIGDDEIDSGKVSLKDMKNSTQEEINFSELASILGGKK